MSDELPMSEELPRLTPRPSIYEYLAARIDETGRLLGEVRLPDETTAEGNIGWAAGAFDGVSSHHLGGDESDSAAEELADQVAAAAVTPGEQNLRTLLSVRPDDILRVIDPMIRRLVELQPPVAGVYRLARWLAGTATERSAVKLGIALLGLTGIGDTAGMLRTLGAHDEFTLYAAVAFGNGSRGDAESEIWALASVVDGWGRIHCVERLADTTDPAIRRWILRTGFRNSVMNEYLAYIAATAGGLLEALRGNDIDRELLDAAADIFEALVAGGPAADITDWAEADDAVAAYLDVLTDRAETLADYRGAAAVRDYLADAEAEHPALAQRCAEILARPLWPGIARAALDSADSFTSWTANRVLRDLGHSTFEHHLAALRANPHGNGWFDAWQQADHVGAQRLVQLVREVLPLDTMASGPAAEMGLEPQWADHRALEWTLQGLGDHPGVGGDLLLVGLWNPVVRNRNFALRTLQQWPRWPDGARELVSRLAAEDPEDGVRSRARELLEGGGQL